MPPTPRKGFFADLFDFGFTDFVTPKVIKFIYVVAIIAITLFWVYSIVYGFKTSPGGGALALIVGPVMSILLLLWVRLWLEFIIVIFQIYADVHAIKHREDSEFR